MNMVIIACISETVTNLGIAIGQMTMVVIACISETATNLYNYRTKVMYKYIIQGY